ncbi:MAG: class I SAM-dependent methyltransferase [Rhizomicrobium sp.]|nr:class I SAM-dependent methyltransferase [Rhizomicrobium sp.]
MQDRQASRTALGVAYIRAAHQLLDRQPLLFPDPIALKLLGPDASDAIHGMIERHQNPYGKGLRSHVCLRSRYAEDKLADEVRAGARWYVMVGAGFDTFAYRQPAWAAPLNIVEIDHPATQQAKRQMLAAAKMALPDNLAFASVDFTTEDLAHVLGRLGIPATDRVVFSWLGVTM